MDTQDFKTFSRYFDEVVLQSIRKVLGFRKRPLKSLKLVPLKELKTATDYIVQEIEPSQSGCSYGPHIANEPPPVVKKIVIPPVRQYKFENVACCITHTVFYADQTLWYETVEGVEAERCDYNGVMLIRHGRRFSLLNSDVTGSLEKGIYLGGSSTSNYYHWMIEILPKLHFISQLGPEYNDYPLLISKSILKFESLKCALDSLNSFRELRFLEDEAIYTVGSLVHISPPSIFPINMRPGESWQPEDHFFRTSSIDYVREGLVAEWGVDPSERKERLFFSRKTKRRNYNEEEMFEIFRTAGFRKVDMGELTLKEQIELMGNAAYIAGPTGAEWTNLIFCKAGTKALCWMNASASGFSCFSNLASYSKVDLRYICYPSKVTDTKGIYSETYELSKDEVLNCLNGFGLL